MDSKHSALKAAALTFGAAALLGSWASLIPVTDDHTPPRIGRPRDLEATLSSRLGTRVHFPPPQVTDDRDPNPRVVFDPPSGALFPPGTSEVVISATDAAGNSASERFTVTVGEAVALPFAALLKIATRQTPSRS